ncbi:MAG TPA: hypothetical protein VGA20_03810 [Gemmatimonadales bacterium]
MSRSGLSVLTRIGFVVGALVLLPGCDDYTYTRFVAPPWPDSDPWEQFVYATCDTDCTTAVSWRALAVAPLVGPAGAQSDNSLAVDGRGRVHASYPVVSYHYRNLEYATCAAGCDSSGAGAWQTVIVDRANVYGQTSLHVDGTERVHVSYHGGNSGDYGLKYATCAGPCTTPGDWKRVLVDSVDVFAGFHQSGYASLAVDRSGRIHVVDPSVFGESPHFLQVLKYATCAADCGTRANWATTIVDGPHPDTSGSLTFSSLEVDGTGRLHVSSGGGMSGLRYATCSVDCGTAASWQTVTVSGSARAGRYAALAADGIGRVHISSYDERGALLYASCQADCAAAVNWHVVIVDVPGSWGWGTAVAVDDAGRIHLVYDGTAGLKYATCAANCAAAGNWRVASVRGPSSTGIPSTTSLAVDTRGRVHVGYHRRF